MRKGEIYQIKIDDISHDGWGVGRFDSIVVFVKGALPDDIVDVLITLCKKNYVKGELIKIIKPSPFRIQSDCEHFLNCGGCSLRNVLYEEELKYKKNRVQRALKKIAHIEDISMVPDCLACDNPNYYRNKAEYAVDIRDDEIVIGFKSDKSDKIVDIETCKLQMPGINETMKEIRNILEEYKEFVGDGGLHHIIVRQSQYTGEIMLILISGYPDHLWAVKPANEIAARIDAIKSVYYAISPKHLRWSSFDDLVLLFGNEGITEKIGKVKLNVSPASFMQVNTVQAAKLYSTALGFADPKSTDVLLDMYCGVGSIGLFMADKVAEVIGVEVVESAILDAKDNLKLNRINNMTFRLGMAEELISEISDIDKKIDIVVLDPPRSGCDREFLNSLALLKVDKIIYISCDPETMARDIDILRTCNYELKKVQPVDMFPRTSHVECISLLKFEN